MALVRPHVKWARRLARLRDLAPALEQAFRISAAGVPGPVFLECPVDLLYPEALVRGWYGASATGAARGLSARAERLYLDWHLRGLFGGMGTDTIAAGAAAIAPQPAAAPAPDEARVRRAARLLRRAARPVLLVGSQALLDPTAVAELVAAVRALGVPVFLSGMARGLLGAADPLQLRHARKQALREADLVILAGVPCDFRLDYGRQIGRSALLVSANRSREDLVRNRRPTVAVPGAPDLFLRRLAAESFPRAEWGPWLEKLRGREAARETEIEARAGAVPEQGWNPIALCRAIERALGESSLVVADGGDFVATASYVLRPRGPLSWLDPGPFGTLGVGAGFALGAKLARPEAEVFLLYGDGALGYSLVEADTFARHGLGVVAVIGNVRGWTQIAREQVEVLKDDVATVLAASDYERAAAGLGACGLRLDAADDADRVLAEARAIARSGRPVYVNAHLGRSDFRKGSISI